MTWHGDTGLHRDSTIDILMPKGTEIDGWLVIPVTLNGGQLARIIRAWRRGGWRWRLVSLWYGVRYERWPEHPSGEAEMEGAKEP